MSNETNDPARHEPTPGAPESPQAHPVRPDAVPQSVPHVSTKPAAEAASDSATSNGSSRATVDFLPPNQALLAGLAAAGIAVATTIAAGIVGAITVAVGSSADGFDAVSGATDDPGEILGLVFLIAGMVLGGEANATFGAFDFSLTMSIWLFPVLLTAGVFGLLTWWAWRQARSQTPLSRGQNLVVSVGVGFVASLVVLVLTLTVPVSADGQANVSAAGWRLVLWGTVLLGAAHVAGGWLRRAAPHATTVVGAVVSSISRAQRWIREPLVTIALGVAVFVPLAIAAIVAIAISQDQPSVIPLGLVLVGNVAGAIAVLVSLGGISANASVIGFDGAGDLLTVFSLGPIWSVVAIIIAILTAAWIAVFVGTRRQPAAGFTLAHAWQLPVGLMVFWVIYAVTAFGVTLASAGSLGAGLGGSISMTWWTIPVLFVWAIAIEFGAQVLPRVLASTAPGLHRALAGRAATQLWAHSGSADADSAPGAVSGDARVAAPAAMTMSPRAKRITLVVAVVAATVAVVGVAAVVTIGILNASRGPVAAAESYVHAIADGRAVEASQIVDPNVPTDDRAYLTDEVLQSADARIEIVGVRETYRGDGEATIAVDYVLDGVQESGVIQATKLPNDLLVLENWRLTSPLLAEITISSSQPMPLVLGGTELTVPADAMSTTIAVYPGRYTITPAANDFFTADPVTVTAGSYTRGWDESRADFAFTPTDQLAAAVSDQVESLVTTCAESTEASPEDCPFSFYSWGDVTDLTWEVVTQPTVTIDESGSRFQAQDGEVRARYTYTPGFGDSEPEQRDSDVSLYFSGSILVDGDTVAIDDGGWGW